MFGANIPGMPVYPVGSPANGIAHRKKHTGRSYLTMCKEQSERITKAVDNSRGLRYGMAGDLTRECDNSIHREATMPNFGKRKGAMCNRLKRTHLIEVQPGWAHPKRKELEARRIAKAKALLASFGIVSYTEEY